jgi:hypothetical protein
VAADIQSANDKPERVSVDENPPSPPDQRKGNGKLPGMGEFGKSPGLMALQGLESMENGMQLIAVAMPQMAALMGPMALMLTRLRQAVPQMIAGGGASPLGSSSMLTPPPGGPMPGPGGPPGVGAPPGIGAQGGAPGAPTPLPPGMG